MKAGKNQSSGFPVFLPSLLKLVRQDNVIDVAYTLMALELEELSDQVIGACIAVHKEKGPGFLESIYENCLKIEFRKRGIRAEFQKEVHVYYDREWVGAHKLDILVHDELVVKLKAIKAFEDVHFAQVRSYLRATGLKHGLLINFATQTLTVKRVI